MITIPAEYAVAILVVLLGALGAGVAWGIQAHAALSVIKAQLKTIIERGERHDIAVMEQRLVTVERDVHELFGKHDKMRQSIDDVRHDFSTHS